MNVSFTSHHGEQILRKTNALAQTANMIAKSGSPLDAEDKEYVRTKLSNLSTAVETLDKFCPVEDDAAYAATELMEKTSVTPEQACDPPGMAGMAFDIISNNLIKLISNTVSKHQGELDGEDKTMMAMVKGTINNIRHKLDV